MVRACSLQASLAMVYPLLQVQFLSSLVRVIGLGVSSLPFMLLLLVVVVVVVVVSVATGYVLVIPFFSVSLSLVLCIHVLAKPCFLFNEIRAKVRSLKIICYFDR